jgi:hypothetical protein
MTEMSLEEIGVTKDPGTEWHPRSDKTEARDEDGLLLDLSDEEVDEHRAKPEAADQEDAQGEPLSAEDWVETGSGAV